MYVFVMFTEMKEAKCDNANVFLYVFKTGNLEVTKDTAELNVEV